MRKIVFLILGLTALPLSTAAKRLPPPVLLPVDDGTCRFVALNDLPDRDQNPYHAGHVAAYLKGTGRKMWEKYLYKVWVDPAKEQDVQDVFIKKMYLERPNRLILQNEKEEWFVLDRRTGDVLTPKKFPKKGDDLSVYYLREDRVEPVVKGDYVIEADVNVSFGRQKVRVHDLPTGRLLWEEKIQIPKIKKAAKGKGNRISFLWLNDKGELEINFGDNSSCVVDPKTGKILEWKKEE